MNEERLDQYAYQAYVLRLWKEGAGRPWRASLETVNGETRHHFADVERLIRFLQMATVSSPEEGAAGDRSE